MSAHLAYIAILSFVLVSWAHPVIESFTPRKSSVVALRRRNAQYSVHQDSAAGRYILFNLNFALRDLEKVISKYASAPQFLSGIGLNADTKPQTGYPPFNDTTILLSHPTNTTGLSLAQVVETEVQSPDIPIQAITHASTPTPVKDFFSTFDVLYYLTLSVGTPGQELTVDIDTGSSDLWIPVKCQTCANSQFSSDYSSTYRNSGRRSSVSYGAGRVFGTLAQDDVSIGNLNVKGQDFIAVNVVSDEFGSEPNDGLMGMGFGTIASSKKPTFFENLLLTHAIETPIFSVHLERGKEDGSQVCFGCYDVTKAVGPITWFPLVSRTYWTIAMDGLCADSTNTLKTKLVAVIDTGTSLIHLPKDVASEFYRSIPGAKDATTYFGEGFYTYPCSKPPSVSLLFSGRAFTISKEDFNLGRVDADSPDCVGGILGLGEGFDPSLAIIGDELLKSWYSVYDYTGEGRVGLAPSVNNR